MSALVPVGGFDRRTFLGRAGALTAALVLSPAESVWASSSVDAKTLQALAETLEKTNLMPAPAQVMSAVAARQAADAAYSRRSANALAALDRLGDKPFAELTVDQRLAALRAASAAGEKPSDPTVSSPSELPAYLAQLSSEIQENVRRMHEDPAAPNSPAPGDFPQPYPRADPSFVAADHNPSKADIERQAIVQDALEIVQAAVPPDRQLNYGV